MSYEKYNWSNGDSITAERLNHIENGVADITSNIMIIPVSANTASQTTITITIDKTFNDLKAALNAGILPVIFYTITDIDGTMYGVAPLVNLYESLYYQAIFSSTQGNIICTMTDPDELLSMEMNETDK